MQHYVIKFVDDLDPKDILTGLTSAIFVSILSKDVNFQGILLWFYLYSVSSVKARGDS
jgi:hypothetical protein